jgi:chemotaxis protein CheC
MRGEALVIYGEHRCVDLADLMGYEHGLDHAAERELLLDVSNMLVGACLGGIAEPLKMTIGFSAPSLMADSISLEDLFKTSETPWNTALLVEVTFSLEQRSFACNLLMLMPDNEITHLATALDRFLEDFG